VEWRLWREVALGSAMFPLRHVCPLLDNGLVKIPVDSVRTLSIQMPTLVELIGDGGPPIWDFFESLLIQLRTNSFDCQIGRVFQQTHCLVGMKLDDTLTNQYFKSFKAAAPASSSDEAGTLVQTDWDGDDYSLRRYFMAGCRVFERPRFLSMSVDDSRVGLRTRMMLAAALPDNTAMWFAPQVSKDCHGEATYANDIGDQAEVQKFLFADWLAGQMHSGNARLRRRMLATAVLLGSGTARSPTAGSAESTMHCSTTVVLVLTSTIWTWNPQMLSC